MPRIRSIKPQFWLDEKLGNLPRDARLTYIGLWNLADDGGVFEWRPQKIRAQLFPYDLELKDKHIEEWLKLLEGTEDIIQFFNEEGKPFGYIASFLEHQDIKKPSGWRFAKPPKDILNHVDKDVHKFEADKDKHVPTDPKIADIAKCYEDNIAQLTPTVADQLKEISKEYPEGWFQDAVKEATSNNKRHLRYIQAILKRWKADGRGQSKQSKSNSTGIEVES
jgi:DnaD/phage-associated family protein